MSGPLVIASLATIPSRRQACMEAVRSLLPQVDEVHVYHNDEDPVRGGFVLTGFSEEDSRKLFQRWGGGPFALGDIGDAGKFAPIFSGLAPEVRAFDIFLACDDDLIYGREYVQTMIAGLERHPGCAVGLHGKIIKAPVRSYARDTNNVAWFHFNRVLPLDAPVNVLGTGLAAFYVGEPSLRYPDDFPLRNAADLNFAAACQAQGIGMRCLAHEVGLANLSRHVNHAGDSLWAEARRDDTLQTDFINSRQWRLIL